MASAEEVLTCVTRDLRMGGVVLRKSVRSLNRWFATFALLSAASLAQSPTYSFTVTGSDMPVIAPGQPPTTCAPEGSLWHDLLTKEVAPTPEGPSLHIVLPKIGNSCAWSTKGGKSDRAIMGIVDRTDRFLDQGGRIPPGNYVGIILPPGSNNDLILNQDPRLPSPTGRAGAIFLLPIGAHDSFCASNGTAGYIIHSGSPENRSLVAGIPSLVMTEESLAQLIANLVARSGPSSGSLGKSYSQVAIANSGRDGWKGFRAFSVSLKRDTPDDSRPADRPKRLSSPAQLPLKLMAYQDFAAIRREVSQGYLATIDDSYSIIDRHFQVAGEMYQLQFEPDVAVRRRALVNASEDAAKVLGLLTEHYRVLSEAMEAGDIPSSQVQPAQLEQHLSRINSYIAQLQSSRYEYTDSLAHLDRLTPDGRLNPEAEFVIPDVPTNLPGCVLRPHVREIPSFSRSLLGRSVALKGRAAIYFTADPNQPNTFRTHVKVLLNVDDFRRVQSEEIRARLPKDGCLARYSVRDDRLFPDPQGRLHGRTSLSVRYGACYSYKYPCWKNWKTYMCRADQWINFGTVNQEIPFVVASRPKGDEFELLFVQPPGDPIPISPYEWAPVADKLKAAVVRLGLTPTRSFFSEDGTSLWWVLEMAGPGKTAGLPCFAQDQLLQNGAF